MGIKMTTTGRLGKPERPSFLSRRAHLLTTAQGGGGGIPPFGRAVRSARRIALSAESARQCRSVPLPSLSVRLADGFRLVCLFAANRCPLPGQPATRLRKPATGSFLAAMDDALPRTVHFLLARQKKQNRPLQGAERT